MKIEIIEFHKLNESTKNKIDSLLEKIKSPQSFFILIEDEKIFAINQFQMPLFCLKNSVKIKNGEINQVVW